MGQVDRAPAAGTLQGGHPSLGQNCTPLYILECRRRRHKVPPIWMPEGRVSGATMVGREPPTVCAILHVASAATTVRQKGAPRGGVSLDAGLCSIFEPHTLGCRYPARGRSFLASS
jgi:hypothetical protein